MAFNNEIEEVKAQIKVLQSKLSFLEELSKTKSPVEEAYKRVYGWYPDTGIGTGMSYVWWDVFCKGYNASKEDCKVEEEPKPKPETLFDIVRHRLGYSIDCCDEIVDAVEEWLSDVNYSDVGGAYERGWNRAIYTSKDKLR